MSPRTERRTFSDLLEQLHADRYTGAIVLQFHNGTPQAWEMPQPSRRFPLDSKPKRAASLRRGRP